MQGGFRPGRAPPQQYHALHFKLAELQARKRTAWLLLVDVKKAFDSVEHELLFRTLDGIGMPENITRMIRHIYHNTTSAVILGSGVSQPFQVKRGVLQGWPLSPTLYALVYDHLLRFLNEAGVPLHTKAFADDLAIIIEETEDLEAICKLVDKALEHVGMTANGVKSILMPVCNTAT